MILFLVLILALGGALLYWAKLNWAVHRAPQLAVSAPSASNLSLPKISVIVPAYNEADNIEACLTAVLNSTAWGADRLEVWAIDDQSTDGTLAIAQTLQQRLNDPRLKVLAGQPRPEGEVWVGKNWACAQAAAQAEGALLLFIDADVRLKPGAIETAVQAVQAEQIDLLSLGPAIICGCLAEWLVQPLMISTILVGFDFDAVNDPTTDDAFAAGPFMLFRRTAYDAIGGHLAVADRVVEDVELARRIKSSGLTLRYLLGSDQAALRMYPTGAALWEGWTKNLYLGSRRNLLGMGFFIALMLLVCVLPWASLVLLALKALLMPLAGWDWGTIALALVVVVLHYDLRRVCGRVSQIPTDYWWLTGVGGLVAASIAAASVIKTETGWGWTWRGRPLRQPQESG